MLPSNNCNEDSCPGWLTVMVLGIIGYVFVTVMFWKDVHADVRVEITRELPGETQYVVQQFPDEELFSMWFTSKLDEGCDPYVTKINIDRNYNPGDKGLY